MCLHLVIAGGFTVLASQWLLHINVGVFDVIQRYFVYGAVVEAVDSSVLG